MTRDSKESELAIDGDWAVLKIEQTFFFYHQTTSRDRPKWFVLIIINWTNILANWHYFLMLLNER